MDPTILKVKPLNVESNVVNVQIFVFDCTPMLDIKPFDSYDTSEDFKVP